MADFFNNDTTTTETTETTPSTFKIGDGEYTQDQLEHLVGLGKIGQEAEEKYNVKIDKVWPNLQQTINDKKELERQLEESRRPTPTQEQLTAQQVDQKVREDLSKLGYADKTEISRIVAEQVAGFRLLDETQSFIDKQVSDGNPATDTKSLLEYMSENGVSKPNIAYKLMFEDQLDAIKEKKLASLKQPGLVTQTSSTAGAKAPAPQKVTKENLQDAIRAALASQ